MKLRPTEWYGNTERTHRQSPPAFHQFVCSALGSLQTRKRVSARTPRVAQLQVADTLARRQRCCTAWTWLFGWADFVRHKVIVANGPLAQGAVWRMQHQEQHRHNGGRPHDTGAQLTPQSAALLHRLQILFAFHLLSLAVPIARPPSPRHLCARSLVGPKCSARPMSWALRANGTMQPDERDTRSAFTFIQAFAHLLFVCH